MRHLATLSLVLTLTLIHHGGTAANAQQNQPQRRARQGDQSGQGRFTFERFSARHDSNQDGKVERDEFKGAPQFFRWLDQDGDGVVTAEEFPKRTLRDGRQQPGGERRVPEGVKVLRDLEYATVDGESLRLDDRHIKQAAAIAQTQGAGRASRQRSCEMS